MVKQRILNFNNLISHFSDFLAFADRQYLYETLKKYNLLGKVFGKSEQTMLCKYLFHEVAEGVNWPNFRPFESCNNDEVEEARLNFFLDSLLQYQASADNYPRAREQKTRQLYATFQEMNLRVKLMRGSRSSQTLSLAFLPCSFTTLERLHKAYPKARELENLRGLTESDLREKVKIRNPALKKLLAFISERLPEQPELVMCPPPALRGDLVENQERTG